MESALLAALRQNGEAYQSDLVRATGFSRSRVSEVLSKLLEQRFVEKMPLGRNYKVILRSDPREGAAHEGRARRTLRLGFTRAAEYPFIVPFRKLLKEKMNARLELKIYDNGMDVAHDLSQSRLDLGIAPLLTHFMFFSLGAPIRILAPAGSGGASVIKRLRRGKPQRSGEDGDDLRVASTKLSTMELLLRSCINDCALTKVTRTVYATSPLEIMDMLAYRRVGAACIWEPYATILERRGFERSARYSDLGEHVCCVLAAGNHLGDQFLGKVIGVYASSMENFAKSQDSSISAYAALAGLDAAILMRVSHEYTYPLELDVKLILNQLERGGIHLPSPSSFSDAIWSN